MAWFIILATTPKGKSLYYCGDGGSTITYRKTRDPNTLCTVIKRVYNEQLFSTVQCSFMGEDVAKKSVKNLQKMQEKYHKYAGYTFEIERADPDWTRHYPVLTLGWPVSGATLHTIKDYRD